MDENQNQEQNANLNNTQNQTQNTQTNYQNPTPKQGKNTGLIVLIVVLLLVIAVGGTYGFMTISNLQSKNDEQEKAQYEQKEIVDDQNNTTKNETSVNSSSTNTSKSSTTKEATQSTSSKDAKASTKESPLKLGEWGLAAKRVSKYLSEEYADKEAVDVPVRVTKVTRGADAEKEVKEWFNGQKFYKYEDPKAYMEWAVVDYEVDLSSLKFDEGTIGVNSYVDSDVKGTDGGSVKYKGITYILSTKDITGSDYVKKPGVYKCKFIVTLPEKCTDYLVKLGSSYNGAESYFKCE